MKTFLRIVVALIFIASGFVKAVDPVGFSFKLEEYFSPSVFNLAILQNLALPLAVLVVSLELVLGLMLLLNIKLKFTLQALIALCIFFGFLTFYSAYFNVVTDCGCFGDAIKFTPWQSFIKDIILLVLLVILYRLYKRNFNEAVDYQSLFVRGFTLFALFLGISFFMFKGISAEPLIDFRDYKIGTDLTLEKQKIAQNPAKFRVVYLMKNVKTGEELKVNQDDYISKNYWKDTNWKILEGKEQTELIEKGYESSISKFNIESGSRAVTDEILKAPRAVLLFSYQPAELSPENIKRYEQHLSREKGLVYGVSTVKNTFKTVPEATMDGVAIKTIARSNPFVLILQNGRIVSKLPASEYFKTSKI